MSYGLQSKTNFAGTGSQKALVYLSRKATQKNNQLMSAALFVAFFAAHIPLALLMSRNRNLATLHAIATIAVGLYLAASSTKLYRVAYVGAYIAGAEVLWRMTDALIFWEQGKYATILILTVAMVCHRKLRPNPLPIVYFLLLLPSTFLTVKDAGWLEARELMSSNLSGPLTLMIAGSFFSQLKVTNSQMRQLFLAVIAPVVGIATIAFFGIATAEEIIFTDESNYATSGGFGPNQVSSVLGLGALLCFFLVLHKGVSNKAKMTISGVMAFLGAQSALTFSRGGLYNALGAIVLASFYLLRDARARIQFAILVVLLIVGVKFIILPRLDSFTGGALVTRFQDTDFTNRDDIVLLDLEIWAENPILGVGPGLAKGYRQEGNMSASTHTEFSRLVAEHGIFGLAALLVLLFAAGRNLIRARRSNQKAYVIALTGWSCLYMVNAAMRLAAPSFMLGLAFVTQLDEEKIRHQAPARRRSQRARLRPGFNVAR